MQCASCDYWKPANGEPVFKDDIGGCHRYAPRATTTFPQNNGFKWPATVATDWCGDYQRHPNRRLQE